MERQNIRKWFKPINIQKSQGNSKSLIMPHQDEAVRALNSYFDLHNHIGEQNGLIVMPTGSGKTYTAVNWLLRSGAANDFRILWLAHRQELIDQTYHEFIDQAPILADTEKHILRVLPLSGMHASMSVASGYDIYVCSIASAANKHGLRFIRRMLGEQGKRKLIVVIDEAHHAISAQYRKVLKRVTELNPNRILLGLTATPTRMQDQEKLKLHRMFNVQRNLDDRRGNPKGYIYDISLKQLIISGFLAKPIHEPVRTQLVGEIEYEFTEEDEAYFGRFGELTETIQSQIARSSARNKVILDQYMKNRQRYGKTLIFAVNQNHAETLFHDLTALGIKCDFVVSRKPGAQETIRSFKKSDFDVLINVQILTEGSDIPDIQTVFLTRETNSDSLLMQMIGRGLRGVSAGGTEVAYIVDFHDTWEKYVFWLDPGKLDIFDQEPDTESTPESLDDEITQTPQSVGIEGEEIPLSIPEILTREPALSMYDIYLMLYQKMKAVWISKTENAILPYGWYSLVDTTGEEQKVLVYEDQLYGYKRLSNNLDLLADEHLSSEECLVKYFRDCSLPPDKNELAGILEYVFSTREMPPFFTLEERKHVDPKVLLNQMESLNLADEDKKVLWLKALFDHSPIIRQIYKTFYAFKTSVFQADRAETSTTLVREEEGKQYNIIEDSHNLMNLYHEILAAYPKLTGDSVVSIEWSQKVYKSWFGLCVANDDKSKFFILINRVLCSPQVDKEVIKYLMFHELLHASGYWNHDANFRAEEWSYPNSDELDGQLDELCIKYNLDLDQERKRNRPDAPSLMKEKDRIFRESGERPQSIAIGSTGNGASEFKYCRECGNKLPATANFCDKCGLNTKY